MYGASMFLSIGLDSTPKRLTFGKLTVVDPGVLQVRASEIDIS
jgi:hypothetical protein